MEAKMNFQSPSEGLDLVILLREFFEDSLYYYIDTIWSTINEECIITAIQIFSLYL